MCIETKNQHNAESEIQLRLLLQLEFSRYVLDKCKMFQNQYLIYLQSKQRSSEQNNG